MFFVLLLFPSMVLGDIMAASFFDTEMRSSPNAMTFEDIAKVSTYTHLLVFEKGAEFYKVKNYRGIADQRFFWFCG